MKKYIIQISTIIFGFFLLGCQNEDSVIFDVNNGQTFASIINGSQQTLPVPDTGGFATIEIGVTTKSNVDRAITLSVDQTLTTADPSEYTIDPTSLIIPAGSFVGKVIVNGNFNAIPETGLTAVAFKLESVEGLDTVLGSTLTHTVNLFRFCPFTNGATFLGDYQLQTLSSGIFGVSTLTEGVVSVVQGSTVADRQFSIAAYPAFGSFAPFSFKFSLICDQLVVTAIDNINVGCGGGNAIGPSATVTSSYNEGDDSELIINFVDDTRGQCDGPHEVSIKLTKI